VGDRRNLVEQQRDRLAVLTSKSSQALDIVTSTVNQLDDINAEIDGVISSIEQYETELSQTKGELVQTRNKNSKISERFKKLIEIDE